MDFRSHRTLRSVSGGSLAASTVAEQGFTRQIRLSLHKVVVVGIGNALEFYDLFAFSYFAIQIGHTFNREAW
jgi:hypothetical protein